MRRVRILEAAADELEAAIAWYDQQRPGLGGDLESAVDATLDLLELDIVPFRSVPTESGNSRLKRLALRRFPFDVVVAVGPDEIVVIAFAHHSRRPGYWRGRTL